MVMAMQDPGEGGSPDTELREKIAPWPDGWLILVLGSALLILGIVLLTQGISSKDGGTIWGGVVIAAISIPVLQGLTQVRPGQARVILLQGRYIGTIRTTGLRWVVPLCTKRAISTRIRSDETPIAKVNDADGNPIEIAAVVVWEVADTAKAAFGVDNLEKFVAVQAETAVRHVATSYAYDSRQEGTRSLRESQQEITAELSAEIADRVAPAGVRVRESRISRLSYAPEIAQAMLRRQQAEAVVAARKRIVEGALGMVEDALARLSSDGLVDLDEERRAAMVSNLLVVLCSEHAAQPVVNTGTLYQ